MASMGDIDQFLDSVSAFANTHEDRAVALLWFDRITGGPKDRSPEEIAEVLHAHGFSRPRPDRLKSAFKKHRDITAGSTRGRYKINATRLTNLSEKFEGALDQPRPVKHWGVVPKELIPSQRRPLASICNQINGAWEYGHYDCCAVMMRRLMESLIIEVYVHSCSVAAIQANNNFVTLEKLISIFRSDKSFVLSRKAPSTMELIKKVGDTAAHDRTYITQKADITDCILDYRKLVSELCEISKIQIG